MFAVQNRKQLAEALAARPDGLQLLWRNLLPLVIMAAVQLLLWLAIAAAVRLHTTSQRDKYHQLDISSSGPCSRPATGPRLLQAIMLPRWLPLARNFTLAVTPQLTAATYLFIMLLWPPPEHLIRWTYAYPYSSAANNMFAEISTISVIIDQVRGARRAAQCQHLACACWESPVCGQLHDHRCIQSLGCTAWGSSNTLLAALTARAAPTSHLAMRPPCQLTQP